MLAKDCLKDLPSSSKENFTKFNPETSSKMPRRRKVSTKDHPGDRLIVAERTSILLRYLQNQWKSKGQHAGVDSNCRRGGTAASRLATSSGGGVSTSSSAEDGGGGDDTTESPSTSGQPARKMPRTA